MKAYQHRVHYYETDKMGITHHSNYIRWMEEARIDYLEQVGWSYPRLEGMGIVSPVRAVSCQYKAPTTFDDRISISASVESFNGVVLRLKYVMANASGKTVFEGHSEHCFLDKNGRILRLKKEFPEFYQAMMDLVPAGEE